MRRLAAASGLGFVLFVILAIVFQGGETPQYDDTVAEFVEYAEDNRDGIQLSSVFMGLAAFQMLWFAGYLRGNLGRAEQAARGFTRLSHIVFAGGIAGAIGLVLSAALAAGAVSLPETTSGDTVRALYLLSLWPFAVASVGFAAMMYTSAFLIFRLRALPPWLGVVGIIGGLAYLLTLFSHLKPEDDGGAFGAFYPIGFLALLIFVIGSSIAFLRDERLSSVETAGGDLGQHQPGRAS